MAIHFGSGLPTITVRGDVYGEVTPPTVTAQILPTLEGIRAGLPPGFLLESVEGGEKWARYSFLGTEPARVFRARGRQVIAAKDRAKFLMKQHPAKGEMAQWMLVWLENPEVFPAWVDARKRAISHPG